MLLTNTSCSYYHTPLANNRRLRKLFSLNSFKLTKNQNTTKSPRQAAFTYKNKRSRLVFIVFTADSSALSSNHHFSHNPPLLPRLYLAVPLQVRARRLAPGVQWLVDLVDDVPPRAAHRLVAGVLSGVHAKRYGTGSANGNEPRVPLTFELVVELLDALTLLLSVSVVFVEVNAAHENAQDGQHRHAHQDQRGETRP